MLTLKNLSLTAADAQGRADIVKNVSLDVEDGKFLVITGPNGGGKTTLAKLIMGLATPTGGQIFLDGEDITVAFNPSYLVDGLSAISEPFVRMKMTTAVKPVEFNGQQEADSDESMDYRYLLVPMRFNN
jgi:ABC-type cobalamin/Fe3+-siderophores transport system ATPase subunit